MRRDFITIITDEPSPFGFLFGKKPIFAVYVYIADEVIPAMVFFRFRDPAGIPHESVSKSRIVLCIKRCKGPLCTFPSIQILEFPPCMKARR